MPILPARFPEDLPRLRQLFTAYAESLSIDLAFQHFDEELATLPGRYAAPRGKLLLAWQEGVAVGCVGLRPLDATVAEVKRLFLLPAARGAGLARQLMEALLAEARQIGYRQLMLDTLPEMAAAQSLYHSLGFREAAPYTANPHPGARFLQLTL